MIRDPAWIRAEGRPGERTNDFLAHLPLVLLAHRPSGRWIVVCLTGGVRRRVSPAVLRISALTTWTSIRSLGYPQTPIAPAWTANRNHLQLPVGPLSAKWNLYAVPRTRLMEHLQLVIFANRGSAALFAGR